MNRLKLAVIFGGCSNEYDVSLRSATAVIQSLARCGHEVVSVGITPSGEWFRYTGDPDRIADDRWLNDADCVRAVISPCRNTHGLLELHGDTARPLRIDAAMPVLHGKNGEDGTIQGLLEMAGIPIVGCDLLSSAVCMDKAISHAVAGAAGIRVPGGFALSASDDLEQARERSLGLGYPLFVKPSRSGSSYGISFVEAPGDFASAVHYALQYDSRVVVEERVEGFEVGCAVIGDERGLILGEVDEIELSGSFFDSADKYTNRTSCIHMPARVSARQAEEIKRTAAEIYRVLGCRGFARVDMFLTPSGEIVFNEVNTIPGFTACSRYPSMLKGAGYTFDALVGKLVELAVTA